MAGFLDLLGLSGVWPAAPYVAVVLDYTTPTPPAAAAGTMPLLRPDFSTVSASGKDRWRVPLSADLDGVRFYANGFDAPWYWSVDDATNFRDMGSSVPTTFSGAVTGGSGFLAVGNTAAYRVVYRNSTLGKETAPQAVSVTNGGGADANVQISDSGSPAGEFDQVDIYRAADGTGTYYKVVTGATMPYTDSTVDDTLITNADYVRRYRTTPPPVFVGLMDHANRIFGWTGKDSNLYYTQPTRTDGEFILDDYPSANLIQIAPEDGYGPIVAVVRHYTDLIVLKRRAAYLVRGTLGDFPGDHLGIAIERMFADRGCLAPRTVVEIEGDLICLDERGAIAFKPGGEPFTLGADETLRESPLAPRWKRLNRDASHLFWAQHNEEDGQIEFHVALDYAPSPNTTYIYDYRDNRWVSEDINSYGTSGGYLDDNAGRQHLCRVDDLGLVWEDGYSNSDGVFAGTTAATISSNGVGTLTCSAATFDITTAEGLRGSALDHHDVLLAVKGENRVHVASSTVISLMYHSTASVADASDGVIVGVIPAQFQTGQPDFGSSDIKMVNEFWVRHRTEDATSTMRFDARPDGGTWAILKEVDMALLNGSSNVVVKQRGRTWELRGVQRHPARDFSIVALHLFVSNYRDYD